MQIKEVDWERTEYYVLATKTINAEVTVTDIFGEKLQVWNTTTKVWNSYSAKMYSNYWSN